MNEPINREEYQQNNKNIMQEIKDLKKDINDIKVCIAGLPEKIKEAIANEYVSKDSFEPVRKITYGLVGAVMLGTIGAILTLIFR
jgi:hypothetical protein